MSEKMTFSEILEKKPIRYQVTNDRRFLFDLQDGRKVELACEYCGSTLWSIGIAKEEEEERLAFRIVCPCFKGIYLLWMKPEPKKEK